MRLLAILLLLNLALTPRLYAVDHELDASWRARGASLEQKNKQGRAGSLRFRFSAHSEWSANVKSLLEVDYVASALKEEHSDGERFNNQPLIPDAPGLDLNQAFLNWNLKGISATLGRQSVNIDDQRFIGSVGVWQNEQSFDSFRLEAPLSQTLRMDYLYIDKVRRIFGKEAGRYLEESDKNFAEHNGLRPLARLGVHDHNTHYLSLSVERWDYHKFKLFYLDMDNKTVAAQRSDTSGLDYRFKIKPSAWSYEVHGSLAHQNRKYLHEPSFYFGSLSLGVGYQQVTAFFKFERMEGDGNLSFITPLATLHDHQGWSDVLLDTPSAGVDDHSVRVVWRSSPWRFDVRVHELFTNNRDLKYGREWDMDLAYAPNRHWHCALRFAQFSPSSESPALEKVENIFITVLYRY